MVPGSPDGPGGPGGQVVQVVPMVSQYCLVLSCIRSAKGLYSCIYWKKWRFGQVSPMPDRQTTEYRATQLVSCIKHKLSHAIINLYAGGDNHLLPPNPWCWLLLATELI